jgi:hypothetical protein
VSRLPGVRFVNLHRDAVNPSGYREHSLGDRGHPVKDGVFPDCNGQVRDDDIVDATIGRQAELIRHRPRHFGKRLSRFRHGV